ncbi:MAG TPA: GntR family transcriptional regulator [Bryobacteraceae bacterium]|nr:GntR family transcriptional regulator [Bryobacteraceae bacterium]
MPPSAKIRIDLNSQVPAYRQIVDAVRVLLVDGTLPPGSDLPSVRRLAMELGVHFNTVGEAYRTLAEEGWLDLRHGRGATVIARGSPGAAPPERLQEFRVQLRNLVAQMRSAGVPPARIAAELRAAMESLHL